MRTAALIILLGIVAGVVRAESPTDWPQFRGPQRDGISPVTGLQASWPAEGPKVVWRRPLGEGYSGVVVVGERLYTMFATAVDGKPMEVAAAFNASTGEPIWSTPLSEKYETEFGHGPRTTPTVVGDLAYVLTARGDLAALATADGAVKWRLNLLEKFGSKQPHWGFSTSALVDGDQLIIQGGGGEGKGYAALDRMTGEVRWTIGDARPGYNSAIPVSMLGQSGYVWIAGEALSFVSRDGKEIWSHPWPKGETHASPIFIAPDRLFASGSEGVGAAVIRVAMADDKPVVEEVWKSNLVRNHFNSSVVHDGHLYGFDNATLKCISLVDGELKWRQRGLGKGSLIMADGHLLVLSDDGQLVMVQATAEAYNEQGRAQVLKGRCWTSPSIAGGRLYLRNHDELVCLDLKG